MTFSFEASFKVLLEATTTATPPLPPSAARAVGGCC
jgi:hypothetical protein